MKQLILNACLLAIFITQTNATYLLTEGELLQLSGASPTPVAIPQQGEIGFTAIITNPPGGAPWTYFTEHTTSDPTIISKTQNAGGFGFQIGNDDDDYWGYSLIWTDNTGFHEKTDITLSLGGLDSPTGNEQGYLETNIGTGLSEIGFRAYRIDELNNSGDRHHSSIFAAPETCALELTLDTKTVCTPDPTPPVLVCGSGYRFSSLSLLYSGNDCAPENWINEQGAKASCIDYIGGQIETPVTLTATSQKGDVWFNSEAIMIYPDTEIDLIAAVGEKAVLDTETILEIRDYDSNELLRVINLHTSCSQNINVGDLYGSFEIIAMETIVKPKKGKKGKNGDCNTPPPPLPSETCVRTSTYTITNSGETNVELLTLNDDVFGQLLDLPVTLIAGESIEIKVDFDPANNVPHGAVVTGTTSPGGSICTAEVSPPEICALQLDVIEHKRCTETPEQQPPAPTTDVCGKGFKLSSLTLRYTADGCFNAGNPNACPTETDLANCLFWDNLQKPGKATFCETTEVWDPTAAVMIIAFDKKDKVLFDSGGYNISPGARFTLTSDKKFEADTFIEIWSEGVDTPVQTIKVHTSCSQDTNVGDLFGSIAIVAMEVIADDKKHGRGHHGPGHHKHGHHGHGHHGHGETPPQPAVLEDCVVSYTYTITNTSYTDINLTSLEDDIFGEQLNTPITLTGFNSMSITTDEIPLENIPANNIAIVTGNTAGGETCSAETPTYPDPILCQKGSGGINGFTTTYTGPPIPGESTIAIEGDKDGYAFYNITDLFPGMIIHNDTIGVTLTSGTPSAWTVYTDNDKGMGAKTTLEVCHDGGCMYEIIHTSCSAVFYSHTPAPLDSKTPPTIENLNPQKGDPSPNWFVLTFTQD